MAVRRLLIAGLAGVLLAGAMPVAASTIDFQNDEFNFHVTFPVGSRVCPAVASNHPYGFYAWYGQPTACAGDTKADVSPSTMGVYATYNVTYQRSPQTLLPKACRPSRPGPAVDAKPTTTAPAATDVKPITTTPPATDGKPDPVATPAAEAQPALAPATLIDAKTLSSLNFRRYKSVQCATVEADGSIDIEVVTQAGKWVDGNEPNFQTPLINYRASLHTSPDRLEQDLPMFRKFLEKVDIKF